MNLVSNIGFGPNATHTTENSIMSNMKTEGLKKIINPSMLIHSINADRYVFENYFGGKWLIFPFNCYTKIKLITKFIWLKKYWS